MDTPLFLNREIRLIDLGIILINLYNMPGIKKKKKHESLQHSKIYLFNGGSCVRQQFSA